MLLSDHILCWWFVRPCFLTDWYHGMGYHRAKLATFLDVALCSMVEIPRRFRGVHCLHRQDWVARAIFSHLHKVFCQCDTESLWCGTLLWNCCSGTSINCCSGTSINSMNVHYKLRKRPPLDLILSRVNSVYILTDYFFMIYFCIILPFMPRSPKWHFPSCKLHSAPLSSSLIWSSV
jgi:hypothetical protein